MKPDSGRRGDFDRVDAHRDDYDELRSSTHVGYDRITSHSAEEVGTRSPSATTLPAGKGENRMTKESSIDSPRHESGPSPRRAARAAREKADLERAAASGQQSPADAAATQDTDGAVDAAQSIPARHGSAHHHSALAEQAAAADEAAKAAEELAAVAKAAEESAAAVKAAEESAAVAKAAEESAAAAKAAEDAVVQARSRAAAEERAHAAQRARTQSAQRARTEAIEAQRAAAERVRQTLRANAAPLRDRSAAARSAISPDAPRTPRGADDKTLTVPSGAYLPGTHSGSARYSSAAPFDQNASENHGQHEELQRAPASVESSEAQVIPAAPLPGKSTAQPTVATPAKAPKKAPVEPVDKATSTPKAAEPQAPTAETPAATVPAKPATAPVVPATPAAATSPVADPSSISASLRAKARAAKMSRATPSRPVATTAAVDAADAESSRAEGTQTESGAEKAKAATPVRKTVPAKPAKLAAAPSSPVKSAAEQPSSRSNAGSESDPAQDGFEQHPEHQEPEVLSDPENKRGEQQEYAAAATYIPEDHGSPHDQDQEPSGQPSGQPSGPHDAEPGEHLEDIRWAAPREQSLGRENLFLMTSGVDRKARKARVRRRNWILSMVLLAFFAVIFGVVIFLQGIMERLNPQDFPSPGGDSISFEVESGWGTQQISRHLVEQDIVASDKLFLESIQLVDSESRVIHPGVYELRKEMPALDAATILIGETTAKVSYVAIKENTRMGAVIEDVAAATGLSVAELGVVAEDPKGFGISSKAADLEGYLHPGEYRFALDADAKTVLKTMVDTTLKTLTDTGITDPDEQYHVLNVASILQAEARPDDYATVAGALENRLHPDNTETAGLLQVDSAVIYGLDRYTLQISAKEKADAGNAYNTYIHKGLPPTPIGSPGTKAINAAAHPEANDYYYWVTVNTNTGETKFATTYTEHLVNQNEFRSWCAANQDVCK